MLRIASTTLIAWLLIPAAAVSAQTDRSRLMGIVTDVSGGALPGATVTITRRRDPSGIGRDRRLRPIHHAVGGARFL